MEGLNSIQIKFSLYKHLFLACKKLQRGAGGGFTLLLAGEYLRRAMQALEE
jgi:hypothetical protein